MGRTALGITIVLLAIIANALTVWAFVSDQGLDRIFSVVMIVVVVVLLFLDQLPYFVIQKLCALEVTKAAKEYFRQAEPELLDKFDQLRSHPEREFATDFGEYCAKCAKMVEESDGQQILTMQTPHVVHGDYDDAFADYLATTVRRIVDAYSSNSDGKKLRLYRRLVLVDPVSLAAEKSKMATFLDALFGKAGEEKPEPSLDNVQICIVNRRFAADVLYSNLDIHITTECDYSVAFQLFDEAHQEYQWQASIHLLRAPHVTPAPALSSPAKTAFAKAFQMAWDKGQKDDGEIIFANDYDHGKPNKKSRDEEKKRLKDHILAVMDHIATVQSS